MGDLLAQRVTILISLITIEEAWWATLHELYFRHIWHPSSPGIHFNFNRSIAKACWSQLMQYKDELKGIIRSLQELQNKGADIHFTPEDQTSFEVCENVPDYMYKHNLLSADALHLSLALSEATTLITFDVNDFKNVLDQSKNLTIILLP